MCPFRPLSSLLWILVLGLSCPSGAGAVVFTEGAQAGVRRENVVIVFDPQTGREEVFWELFLDRVPAPFGWLIPLPPRAEVEVLPFGLLGEFTRRYPAETPKKAEGEGYRHLDVKAGAGQRRRPPKRPALVLPAVEVFPGDARAALTARLQRLDLVGEIPHGAGSVALLHVNESTATRARVAIRLSFETDRLVFPYDEPRDVGADARRLVAWVVSETPVELLARAGDGIVSRPWRAGVRHRATRSAVRAALGRFKTRLPGQGSLWIQTFGEQKADRRGYGPILAVPDTWLGTSGDGVVQGLGVETLDPVFARVLAGKAALSELPLRDEPRRVVHMKSVAGPALSPAIAARLDRTLAECSVSAKARPVIEFMLTEGAGGLVVGALEGQSLRRDERHCLEARVGKVSLGDATAGRVLKVRLSRR